jgi:hypothetical protein
MITEKKIILNTIHYHLETLYVFDCLYLFSTISSLTLAVNSSEPVSFSSYGSYHIHYLSIIAYYFYYLLYNH